MPGYASVSAMSDARAPVCPDSAGDRPPVPSVAPSELHYSVTNDGERSLVLYISSLSLESVVSAETSLEALFWGLCRKVYSIPLDLPPHPPQGIQLGGPGKWRSWWPAPASARLLGGWPGHLLSSYSLLSLPPSEPAFRVLWTHSRWQ